MNLTPFKNIYLFSIKMSFLNANLFVMILPAPVKATVQFFVFILIYPLMFYSILYFNV